MSRKRFTPSRSLRAAADGHAITSHRHPRVLAHSNSSVLPVRTIDAHVEAFHGHPRERTHSRTSIRPERPAPARSVLNIYLSTKDAPFSGHP